MRKDKTSFSEVPRLSTLFGSQIQVLNGTLVLERDIQIDGELHTNIMSTGRLIITAKASVHGNIVARDLVVAGYVKGQIHARERAILKSSAVVLGQIQAPDLVVEDGAHLSTLCAIGQIPSKYTMPAKNIFSGGDGIHAHVEVRPAKNKDRASIRQKHKHHRDILFPEMMPSSLDAFAHAIDDLLALDA